MRILQKYYFSVNKNRIKITVKTVIKGSRVFFALHNKYIINVK